MNFICSGNICQCSSAYSWNGTACVLVFSISTLAKPKIDIFDFSANPSSIYVSNSGFLSSITVDVQVIHSRRGDLRLVLTAPNGATVILHNRTGGSSNNIIGNYPGTIAPFQSLSILNGIQIQGTWTLTVYDEAAGNDGKYMSWRLNLT